MPNRGRRKIEPPAEGPNTVGFRNKITLPALAKVFPRPGEVIDLHGHIAEMLKVLRIRHKRGIDIHFARRSIAEQSIAFDTGDVLNVGLGHAMNEDDVGPRNVLQRPDLYFVERTVVHHDLEVQRADIGAGAARATGVGNDVLPALGEGVVEIFANREDSRRGPIDYRPCARCVGPGVPGGSRRAPKGRFDFLSVVI